MVGHLPAHAKKTTPAAAPVVLFPSLGGVAVAKRLTGWSVTFLHTLKKTTPAATAFLTCDCEKREPSQGNARAEQMVY